MSTSESNKHRWAQQLHSDSGPQQATALRQISSQEHVSGLTARIVTLAGSRDDEVRMWSAEALETAVQPDASEVLLLIQLLEQATDGETCYWAATMLGRLGTDAGAAAGALESCLRTSMYLPARERATWALCQIGATAEVAIPALTEAAENAPPRLKRMAVAALQQFAARSSQHDAESGDGGEEAAA